MNKELQIDLDDSAKAFLNRHGAKSLTVDIEMFGGCIVVTEADVKLGPPDNPHHFEKYEIDGFEVYVFRTVKFQQNRLHIYKKKGLLAKKGLEAGKIKQV